MLKPRVQTQSTDRVKVLGPPSKQMRLNGRTLTNLRLRIWQNDPRCAMCGRVVLFNQFDLDHKLALQDGGGHDDANLQVLCNTPDGGCHAIKTRGDGSR